MKRAAVCAAVLALALLPAASAQAQKKMYKCGSQFQDRPCDGNPPPAAAPKAAGPVAAAQKGPSTADENRRQIRCDNMGRQVLDLRQREGNEKNADAARSFANQRQVVETRMKSDNCEPV
jgi:hypothetical protein